MMDLSGAHGVTVKGNNLYLDALAILPPPVIRGRLSSVRIEAGQLIQTVGDPRDTTLPPQTIDPAAKNYMLYRGGTLHFTKALHARRRNARRRRRSDVAVRLRQPELHAAADRRPLEHIAELRSRGVDADAYSLGQNAVAAHTPH